VPTGASKNIRKQQPRVKFPFGASQISDDRLWWGTKCSECSSNHASTSKTRLFFITVLPRTLCPSARVVTQREPSGRKILRGTTVVTVCKVATSPRDCHKLVFPSAKRDSLASTLITCVLNLNIPKTVHSQRPLAFETSQEVQRKAFLIIATTT